MKSRFMLMLILLISFVGTQFGQGKDASLNELIQEAIRVSPKIKLLQSKFNIAKAEIEIGTNLPDPVLKLGLINMPTNSFSFTQEPMTGKIVGLSQKIPFPGALSAASDVKSVDTLIVQQEIADLKNNIMKNVSELYFRLQLSREEIRLAEKSIMLLKQISNVVKRKYEVGTASLQNVIQVEVQITRVKDKIETLKGKENSAQAQLNALLLKNDESNILTSNIVGINNKNLNTDSLLSLAAKNRPALKSINLLSHKAELMQRQAEYSFYPNFNFGLQYSQRDHNAATGAAFHDFLSVVVGVTLPINYGGNKTAKVEKEKYLQGLYNDKYNSSLQLLQQSFGKINAKLAELESREKLIVTTLLPQAEQAYKSSIADYQVSKIDFVNVIKAEDDIIKINTELAKVRTDYQTKIAQLEFLSGTNFNN